MVFVTNITSMGTNLYISCKMIDVQTARIDKQKTSQTQKGSSDLLATVQKMVREMFADEPKPVVTPQPKVEPKPESKPVTPQPKVEEKPASVTDPNKMTVDGRSVFKGGRELSKEDVRKIMADTDALQMYNKGMAKNKNGNIFLIAGAGLFAGGVIVAIAQPFQKETNISGPASTWGYYDDNNIWHEQHYTDNTNTYYEYANNSLPAAIGFMAAGAASAITGIVIKSSSKSLVKQSVNMYNSATSKTTSMNLKIGFTGNRIGLALNF
jgi:hypothetical protein